MFLRGYWIGLRRLPWLAFIVAAGCAGDGLTGSAELLSDLTPVPSSLRRDEPYFSAQPNREHPHAVALSPDGSRLYVVLHGNEAEPGNEVAVVDAATLAVIERIEVGSSPTDIVLHPTANYLLVTNRYSAYLSVIDTESNRQVQKIPVPYYATKIAFNAAGDKLWITNRWLDAVQVFDVGLDGDGGLELTLRDPPGSRLKDRLRGFAAIPVGANPRGIALDEVNRRVFVGALLDFTIAVIDMDSDVEIDTDRDASTRDPGLPDGITRLKAKGPINDLIVVDKMLYVATGGQGAGYPAFTGPDADGDGLAGDGTPNLHFQDVQNDIATWFTATLVPGPRYTSDTLSGSYQDVPEGTPGLEAPALRVVHGALQEQLTVMRWADRAQLVTTSAGTGEVELYDIASDGALTLADAFEVGLMPYGVVVDPSTGAIYVANRLSEDVARVDPFSREVRRAVVGDVSGGAFPATDAEIGELLLLMTSLFGADRDQTCEHCHRDLGSQKRRTLVPHLATLFGARSTPPIKNMLRTPPFLFENALGFTNFGPIQNEFARLEAFGEGRARSDYPDRATFYRDTVARYVGRTRSFGDARPERDLDFDGMTEMLGAAMIIEPRLLPNPNPTDTFAVERGLQLFESSATACSRCHPAPHFAIADDFNPGDLPLAMKTFSSPTHDGRNIDLVRYSFETAFSAVHQDRFGVPSLRGLWDRPEMFYHDGRTTTLLEALATPQHPALRADQRGVNEKDGALDLHGGTSQLTAADMRDLIEYLLTIE